MATQELVTINGVTTHTLTLDDGTVLYAGVAKIGRSGTKIHPVFLVKDERRSNPRMTRFLLHTFRCSCTGTANGSAYHTGNIWLGQQEHITCGNTDLDKLVW